MSYKNQYIKALPKLLNDTTICTENRRIIKKFYEKQELKLKRINGLSKLDESCYLTLYWYIGKIRNINRWMNNKPWKKLTKKDLEKFYNDFEDNKLLSKKGLPIKDKASYYNRIIKSTLFKMAGKHEVIKEIMENHGNSNKEEVRFFEEDTFKSIVDISNKPLHICLFWLAWDFGENIAALLQLRKKDFIRQQDPETKQPEYRLEFRPEILKRSRRARSELSLYPETVRYLDIILKNLKPDDKLFNFEYHNAKKILNRAVDKVGAKCIKGQRVSWKDFRSSMACYLLKTGWTSDEVNSRLGHKPSSSELDKYINFLALDRHKPKRKIYDNNLQKMQEQIDKLNQRDKHSKIVIEDLQNRLSVVEKYYKKQAIIKISKKKINQVSRSK